MNDISNIRARDFRRLGREAIKGRFWTLCLATLVSLLPGMIYNINALPRTLETVLRLAR